MSANIRTHKILIVDDDAVIRDMMVDMLGFIDGTTVEVARNGREALDKLQSAEDYLVFLDLMMPIMNGYEFSQRLNADPQLRRRHIIIVMSAMDKLAEAVELQADAILPKPFAFEDVTRIMQPYM